MSHKEKIQLFKRCIAEQFNEDPASFNFKRLAYPYPEMRHILIYILGQKLNLTIIEIARIVYGESGNQFLIQASLTSLANKIKSRPHIKEAVNNILSNIENKLSVHDTSLT